MRSAVWLAVISVLGAGQAMAADWSLHPLVSVVGVYNDNIELANDTQEKTSVTGAELDAELRVRSETQRSHFQITPRLRSTFYPSESEQEADDQFVHLDTAFSTLRTRSSLDASWSNVTMLGSYFPSAAVRDDDVLGEPDAGEGVVQAGARKNREELLQVAPVFSYELSQRGLLELRLGYLQARYDAQVTDDTEDYDATVARLAYGIRTSQTALFSVRGAYSTYNPAAAETTAAYGLDVEWSNRISATAELFARAGAQQVETAAVESRGGSSWDTGFSGGAGVRWQFVVSQIFLDLGHGLSPSSSGGYVTRDQLRAEWTRRIAPMANVWVGARVITDSGPSREVDFEDRTYATGTIGFDWQFVRQWSLTGSYIYSWQDYESAPADSSSNAVKLGLVWEPMSR